MNGQDILEKMRDVYANFDSYTDIGTVESPGLPGPGLEFQSYFKRPSNFRFHWLSWHPYFGKTQPAFDSTVWTDGSNFKSLFLGVTKNCVSFTMMVAGATGVSRGAVHKLLNVLVPGSLQLNHLWQEMTGVRVLADELVDEVECFHIIGTVENSEDCEVWLEKDRYIVRRLKETTVITEEMSARMSLEQQSKGRIETMTKALRDAGLRDEEIAQTLALSATVASKPMTYCHVYNYTTITVDQPIDEALFTS